MKKLYLESETDGEKWFVEILNSILEQSNYNLDRFVKGDVFAMPDDVSD